MRLRLALACLENLKIDVQKAKECDDQKALAQIAERIIALYQGLNVVFLADKKSFYEDKTKKIV